MDDLRLNFHMRQVAVASSSKLWFAEPDIQLDIYRLLYARTFR